MPQSPADRKLCKERVLIAAQDLVRQRGLENVRQEDIAAEAEVAKGSVTNYFGSMEKLYRAVVRRAVETSDTPVLLSFVSQKEYRKLMDARSLRLIADSLI